MVLVKKQVKMKAGGKPAPPTQKGARKTAVVPSVAKPTISTSRKIRAVEGEHLAGRDSKATAPSDLVEPSPTSQDPIQYPEEATHKVKTYLNAKQLREFKDILLEKRDQLAGDLERLTSEALKGNGQGNGDQSTMPIHMADLGSDTWEQDFTIGLIANEQNIVRDIDDALERIADRTYGMCLATDQEISLARLHAKPWAKYCIEYERAREEGRAP